MQFSLIFIFFHFTIKQGTVLNEPDLNKMTEEELQFYYFKIHDSDANNKLDGSELVKSLIHWHSMYSNIIVLIWFYFLKSIHYEMY